MKKMFEKGVLMCAVLALSCGVFLSCKQNEDDDDDCPSGGYHIWYSNSSGDHEYSSASECSSNAYSRGYKYYCYDGKCHAYYTK